MNDSCIISASITLSPYPVVRAWELGKDLSSIVCVSETDRKPLGVAMAGIVPDAVSGSCDAGSQQLAQLAAIAETLAVGEEGAAAVPDAVEDSRAVQSDSTEKVLAPFERPASFVSSAHCEHDSGSQINSHRDSLWNSFAFLCRRCR